MGALKERWLKLLCEKVAIIDKAYASLFSKMNCEGAVRVKESEDYADWGLEILVKFRNTSELKPLSKESNSGGERSVSTMLYLLGLQAVTDVPFRVVDEINQGMDAVNERMIFDRIVEQSNECSGISNDSSKKPPQYFLITPKLLPNLNYEASEKITILNVFNGFWNLPTEVLDLRKFI